MAEDSSGVFAPLRATPTPVRYLHGGVLINQMGGQLTHRIGPRATIVTAMGTSALVPAGLAARRLPARRRGAALRHDANGCTSWGPR